VPLGSKSLAFLIENSSNQNSSQLADNKQKRPVLIENFEPNRARVFAPLYPEALRRGMLSRDACQRVVSRLNKASSARVLQTEKSCANESAHELSRLSAREVAFLPGLPRAFFAKGSVCSNTFLPGSAQHVESVVTYSKQSTGELLPGSRIARCPSRTFQRVAHFCPSTLNIREGERFAGVVSRNTDRSLRSTCLNALSPHLTNCRLNGLQLFPRAGVCNKRDMQEIPARADNVRVTHSEASFVVE
jgi:hypothetical protein